MLKTYTARYTKISSGYMGQLVEWPEVITEGETLEDSVDSSGTISGGEWGCQTQGPSRE